MKIRLLGSTFVACSVLLFSAGCTSGPAPDLGERDATVSSVMQAFHAPDRDQLANLAQPGPQTADSYAQLMISQWGGGQRFRILHCLFVGIHPDVVAVRVSTEDPSGRPADVEFSLRWNDRAWLLDIGSDLDRTGASTPARP
jgi:hypothetical protein